MSEHVETTGKICAEESCGFKQKADTVEVVKRSALEEGKDAVYRTGMVLGKTAAGVGIGIAAGVGALIAASVAEVVIPAALVMKAFGLTGGAIGFLRGIKNKYKNK